MNLSLIRDITDLDRGAVAYMVKAFNGALDMDTFRGVFNEIDGAVDVVCDGVFSDGFSTAPLYELALRERSKIYSDKPTLDMAYRRLYAQTRDITDVVLAHVAYRRAPETGNGNVIFCWRGPTGMTKSSCMLGFCEATSALAGVSLREVIESEGPDALRRYIAYNVGDIPTKLPKLRRGEALMIDEEIRGVGEGSKTDTELMANIEDMVRKRGTDIHYASPSGEEHATSQGQLEVIGVDWKRHRSRFLLSLQYGTIEPLPLGMVEVPWASKAVYDAYSPIKDEIIERTVNMRFHAASAVSDELVRGLFEDTRMALLLDVTANPKKADFKRWVKRIARSMSTNELDQTAAEIEEMWAVLRRRPEHFADIYGWKPSDNMIRLARRGQREGGVREGDGEATS